MILLAGCAVLAADDPVGQSTQCAGDVCVIEAGNDIDNTPLRVVREPGEEEQPDAGRSCRHHRWYRERVADGKRQLLLDICNDGYGASGVGEDSVSVDGPVFTHSRYGGSAWRWDKTRSVDVRTWLATHETSSSYHNGGAGGTWVDADWQGQRILAGWGRPACGPDGEPVTQDELLIGPELPNQFLPIPVTTAIPADWQSVRLGTCAARADAASAFVPFGGPGQAGDAAIKVAMADDRTLIVEWKDDAAATPKAAEDWLGDDHLEIWATADGRRPGAPPPNPGSWLGGAVPFEGCADSGEKPVQWAVRVSDGKVYVGYGAPKGTPKVTLAKDGRARIVLPWAPAQIAVLYSDADGASGQERLVGTSDVRYGKRDSIGFAGLPLRCGKEKDSLYMNLPDLQPTTATAPVLTDG